MTFLTHRNRYRKLDKMRKQRRMFKMKEQEKKITTEELTKQK